MSQQPAVTPLTNVQQRNVNALLSDNRLQPVGTDLAKAARFLQNATDALNDLANITSKHVQFDVAYNACHDVGEAMLATYGFRTAPGTGAHVAIGQFLEAIFDTPPGQAAAQAYDTLRGTRNGLRYRANSPSKANVTAATQAAQGLLTAASARLQP